MMQQPPCPTQKQKQKHNKCKAYAGQYQPTLDTQQCAAPCPFTRTRCMAEDESAAYNANVHSSKPLTRSKPHYCLVQSLLQQSLLQLLQIATKQLSSAPKVKHL